MHRHETTRRDRTARFARLLALALALASAAGCQPSLPGSTGESGTGGEGGALVAAPHLVIEPPAEPDAVPRAVRFRVVVAGLAPDPVRCVLATGELSDAHLRQLTAADLSAAFTERLLPVRSWLEIGEGEASVTLAPARLLDAGETYTVACGEPALAFAVVVASDDVAPVLRRLWPPAGGSATTELEIWCGDAPVPELEVPASLAPGGPAGTLRAGATTGLPSGCVRFDASTQPVGDAAQPSPFDDAPGVVGWLPPVAIVDSKGSDDSEGTVVALEPAPLALETEAAPFASLPCQGATPLSFGPGCAALLDDRIAAQAPDARLLWIIDGSVRWLGDVPSGAPFVIAPLAPQSAVGLTVTTLDVAGVAGTARLGGTTAAAMPHVVLSEVLANPAGAEPAQEWVELLNTGLAAAELGGMVLADIGGETMLPAATLAPGAFALVVSEAFVEDDGLDPPVPAGALVLRVDKLGKSGLSNSGEPLELRDGGGAAVSRFPPAPKPKPGGSVARVDPLAPDGIASSFAHATPTPAAPNAPLPVD